MQPSEPFQLDQIPPPSFVGRWERSYHQGIEREARRTKVHVFVMGPSPLAGDPPAALRRELITRCKGEGFTAFAEHSEIAGAVKRHLGPDSDLCTIERQFAKNVDVLVFIPSSAGSIAELGYFAALHSKLNVGRRSVIFFSNSYSGGNSFLSDGPAKVLQEQGAMVHYIDYANVEAAWERLQAKIDATRRQKLRDKAG